MVSSEEVESSDDQESVTGAVDFDCYQSFERIGEVIQLAFHKCKMIQQKIQVLKHHIFGEVIIVKAMIDIRLKHAL